MIRTKRAKIKYPQILYIKKLILCPHIYNTKLNQQCDLTAFLSFLRKQETSPPKADMHMAEIKLTCSIY
jgi:hypothetical protein